MVNKKVILGILTIGMLATVAGAGTWAVYKNTLTVDDASMELMPWGISAKEGAADATTLNDVVFTKGEAKIEGIELENINPVQTTTDTVVRKVTFYNSASTPAVISVTGSGTLPAGITVQAGDKIIGSSTGGWGTGQTFTLGAGSAATPTEQTINIEYNFDGTSNNNGDAGKTFTFDVVYDVTP